MKIIGMDIHRSFAQVAILDDGKITKQLRVDLTHEPLVAFAKTLSLEDEVVIEVTGNSAAVERLMRPHVKRVVVANPSPARSNRCRRLRERPLAARRGDVEDDFTSRRKLLSRGRPSGN